MSTRAVMYFRRSKKLSADEKASDSGTVSVEDQRKRCVALLAREGYEPVGEFVDDGVSAWQDSAKRDGFKALVSAVQAGRVDVVVADAPDRLSRAGGGAYLAFLNLCGSHGVKVHTVASGITDPNDEAGEIPSFLQGWQAKKESSDKSRRLKGFIEARAQEGKPRAAGVRPFGYLADKETLHPEESALIRQAMDDVLLGRPLNVIVRAWTDAGVKTTMGGLWNRRSLKLVLTRPRNAGLVVLNGAVLPDVVGSWQTICTVEEHEQLNALLTVSKGAPAPEVNHLLSGLLRCSCGHSMRGATGGRGLQIYRCASRSENLATVDGPHVLVVRDIADRLVTDRVIDNLLVSPLADLPDGQAAASLGALYASLAAVKAKVGTLVDLVMSGALKPVDVAAKRAELDSEEEQIRDEIRERQKDNARAAIISDVHRRLFEGGTVDLMQAAEVKADLREKFAALALSDKRALIAGLVPTMTVLPGRQKERVDFGDVDEVA